MKKNILSVIGAATVAAVALKLTTKYVKNEVIKELEDDGYLYDDDDCDDCDECCGCDERMPSLVTMFLDYNKHPSLYMALASWNSRNWIYDVAYAC